MKKQNKNNHLSPVLGPIEIGVPPTTIQGAHRYFMFHNLTPQKGALP